MKSKSYVGVNLVVENQIACSFWRVVPPDTLACFRDTLLCLAPSLQVILDLFLIDVNLFVSWESHMHQTSTNTLNSLILVYLALLRSKAYPL